MRSAQEIKFGSAQVELTSRCNLRCRTCLYHSHERDWNPQDLSPTAFERLLDCGSRISSMHLQGWGESLLLDNLPEIVRKVRKSGAKVSLSSNGTIMSLDMAQSLITEGVGSMAFSLASAIREEQDRLRGGGAFDSFCSSVQTFAQARGKSPHPPILINYLLTRHNMSDLSRVQKLCSKLGADEVRGTHMVHIVSDIQASMASYNSGTPYLASRFKARISYVLGYPKVILPSMTDILAPVCQKNPVSNFFIGSDGSVSPCVYLNPPIRNNVPGSESKAKRGLSRLVFGDLNKNSLDDIWQNPEYTRFRDVFQARIRAYDDKIAPVRPDFDGADQLRKSIMEIREVFSNDLQAPEPCNNCPCLRGH